jgi:hypothetical protein
MNMVVKTQKHLHSHNKILNKKTKLQQQQNLE